MNIIKNLKFGTIGKFSYRFPILEYLRIKIPKQRNIERDCKIGQTNKQACLPSTESYKRFCKHNVQKCILYIR